MDYEFSPHSEQHVFSGILRETTPETHIHRLFGALHHSTRRMMQANSKEDVCEIYVETAHDLLEQQLVGIWLYDQESEVLSPCAWTNETEEQFGPPPIYEEGQSLSWNAFDAGETRYYRDVRSTNGIYNPETAIQEELIIPLLGYGVINVTTTESKRLQDGDRYLLLELAANTETALEQADSQNSSVPSKRTAESEADEAEHFARILAHELRNPLSVASGRLELAREECKSEHLQNVASALERCEQITENVLQLARINQPVDDVHPVSLPKIARDAWASVKTREADLQVAGDIASILADRTLLQQLLENLFRNAVDHGGSDVTVTVGELAEGFYVEDDGTGIPKEEHERIFETGYSTSSDGFGLGLRIVKQIADAHGWDIRLAERSDAGARFEVTGVDTC